MINFNSSPFPIGQAGIGHPQDRISMPQDVNKLTNDYIKSIKVEDSDIVICTSCQCEFFVSGVRLAKKKIDLKNEAVGLLHERPYLFCSNCGTRLHDDIKEIKTKKDLPKDGTVN